MPFLLPLLRCIADNIVMPAPISPRPYRRIKRVCLFETPEMLAMARGTSSCVSPRPMLNQPKPFAICWFVDMDFPLADELIDEVQSNTIPVRMSNRNVVFVTRDLLLEDGSLRADGQEVPALEGIDRFVGHQAHVGGLEIERLRPFPVESHDR